MSRFCPFVQQLIVLLLCFMTAYVAAESSPRLDIIKERGVLMVGVKTDYPPWGFYDDEGNIVGIEPDLARDVADRLNVELALVPVTASNRIGKVEDGSIDLLIATMADTATRREQTGIISPSYYASGATVLTPSNSSINSWSDLYGQSVCLAKNAYFNRELRTRFLIKAKEYEGTRDSLLALEIGQCVGWIFDDTAIANVLREEAGKGLDVPLDSIMVTPWAVAVSSQEQETAFGRFISDAVIDWHRKKTLMQLELKWGLANSGYIKEQAARWAATDQTGEYVCQKDTDGNIPVNCLYRTSVLAKSAVNDNFLSNLGIDFPPIYDELSKQALLIGIAATVGLSFLSILGSLMFGVLMGVLLFRSSNIWQSIFATVSNLFRMTPPLLSMYILFFGVGGILAINWGLHIHAAVIAVLVFSTYAGASNALLLWHALEAERTRHPRTAFNKVFAQAFRNAFEGINANSINLVKAMGIASVIAVPELVSATNNIIAEFGSKSVMMTFLLVFYFCVVTVFMVILNRVQRRVVKGRWS